MNRLKVITLVVVAFSLSAVLGIKAKAQPTQLSATNKPELVIQNGHAGDVTSVAFSPDGKLLASGSYDDTIKLWDITRGRLITTLQPRAQNVLSVAFSPEGKFLASGHSDNTMRLCEITTGNFIRTLQGHSSYVRSVTFSPDGKTIVSGSWDKTIKLWEVSTGKLLRTLQGHMDNVESVAFSPDGKIIASGSWDKSVKLWEASTGRLLRTLQGHTDKVVSVVFSPDGKIIASGSWDKTIKLWEASTGRLLRTLQGASNTGITAVFFMPDGNCLASASGRDIKVWEISTGKLIRTVNPPDYVAAISISPDGKTMAAAGCGKKDENHCCIQHIITLWDIFNGRLIDTLKGHSFEVNSVSFSRDGKIIGLGYSFNIKLWGVTRGKWDLNLEGHSSNVLSISFSPTGKILGSASIDGTIKLWDVATGKLLQTLEGHSSVIESISFSPDGKILASGSWDETIKLWETTSGKLIRTIGKQSPNIFPTNNSVTSVSFHPDNKIIASANNNSVKLWEWSTGRLLQTLQGHSNTVTVVSFSPDGKFLASASADNTIKLWEVVTGKMLSTLSGHSAPVLSISFSPDGKTLASGSADTTIKLFEVPTGRLMHTLVGHSSGVCSVSFSPNSKILVSGSGDTTVKIWDTATGKLLCSLLAVDDEDWVVYTPEGYFDTSANGKQFIGWTVGLKNYSFEQFWDEFYMPGLFSRVVSGQQVVAKKDIRQGFATPPEVTIVSPKAGETINSPTLQVVVQATDTGGGVQDIRLYHQGKLVGGEGRGIGGVRQSGKVITQTFTVTLVEGENILRATAYSSENIEAVPYEVKIRSAVVAKKPNLFVVAVGINKYKNPKYSLKYSRADAESVIQYFSAQKGRIYENVYVKSLFDEQATRENILDALQLPIARPEDVVIIYLAGHGVAVEGSYYFLPYELPDASDENIKKAGIKQDEIIGALKAVQARKVLLLLDTCQSGALVVAMRGVEEERAVRLLSKTAGVHVLAASKTEQAAAEMAQLGHGLFTYAILQGLQGKADGNKDRTVRISELLGFVCSEVATISEQQGRPQYPTMDIHGDDFPLAVY